MQQDRAFPFQSTRIAGFGFKFVFPVRCCKCGLEKDFESHKILPDEIIHKKFMQWGWLMGRNRSFDICPQCLGITRENKLAAKFKVTHNSAPILPPIEVVQQVMQKREAVEKAVHDGLFRARMFREITSEVKEMKTLMRELIEVVKAANKKAAPKKKAAKKPSSKTTEEVANAG